MTTTVISAKKIIESICGKDKVFFCNEGFKVCYTFNESKQADQHIKELQSAGFSKVERKGSKFAVLIVHFVSRKVLGFKITEIEF